MLNRGHLNRNGFRVADNRSGWFLDSGRKTLENQSKSILIEKRYWWNHHVVGVCHYFPAHLDLIFIHAFMRRCMRSFQTLKMPVYLDQVATEMLQEARNFARESDILNHPFFQYGKDMIWFTWCGTRVNRTLLGLGLYKDLDVSDDGIALTV